MSNYKKSKNSAVKHTRLWHYTNYEALKTIIESKSLRLTNIKELNDLFENEYLPDYLNGKLYIASFTHREIESYFFWSTYTKEENGVIIVFNTKKLKNHIENISMVTNKNNTKIMESNEQSEIYYIKSLSEKNKYNWYIKNIELLDVIYKKYREGKSDEEKTMFGFYKSKEWDNEEETRIRLCLEAHKDRVSLNYKTNRLEYNSPEDTHLYMQLSDELIEQIEVIINPWATDDFKRKVEVLLQVNNIPIKNISDSSLKGKVKKR